MGFKVGNDNITKIYLGDREIQRVFLGSNIIYDSEQLGIVSRSDNGLSYDTLEDAINSIIIDEGSNLSQDITLNVNQPLTHSSDEIGNNKFYLDLKDFNHHSEYFLYINGNDNLTINGKGLGGFKLTNCSNFVFDGINFINISNNFQRTTPEETCAVFAQGSRNDKIKNIIVKNCIINGIFTDNDNNYLGLYALIFKNCTNASVNNVEIQGFKTNQITGNDMNVLSLSNLTFTDNIVDHTILGQPAAIRVNNLELLYLEDNFIDMANSETVVVGNNINRLISKRNIYKNAKGEVFRLQSFKTIELFHSESDVYADNLQNPHDFFIKQYISLPKIKEVKIINSNIRLTSGGDIYDFTRFVRLEETDKVIFVNNIVDFDFPFETDNFNDATIISATDRIGELTSDYNAYIDTLRPSTNNRLFNVLYNSDQNNGGITLSRVDSLDEARTLGYDTNSTLILKGTSVYSDINDIRTILPVLSELDVDTSLIPKFDNNKHILTNLNDGNLGSNQINSIAPTIDNIITYDGIDTFIGDEFNESALYSPYSNNTLLFISEFNEKGRVVLWSFNDENDNKMYFIGNSISANLLSKLDDNDTYIGDMLYDIEITKI
jgi:hypothetical protein